MNKLERYAKLKIEEKRIQADIKALKADVTNLVFDTDEDEIKTEFGTFELRSGRKMWKYSDKLVAREKEIKEAIKVKKKIEEADGVARLESAPTNLVFTARKGK